MTTPSHNHDATCDLIVSDLIENRRWSSAIEISLFEHQVVAAREFFNSPLVVFIPLGENVKLSDMELVLNRVRQLGLDLSTGEVTIERHFVSEVESNVDEPVHDMALVTESLLPDSFLPSHSDSTFSSSLPSQSGERFVKDASFDRDRCLRLHREVTEKQFEYELAREAEEKKKARLEEVRLGLIPVDCNPDHTMASETPADTADNEEMEHSSFQIAEFDRTVDIHISAMFAFTDGGNLCYYQATLGLAPPDYCPDDSDDEKPLEQVQQEQKKVQNKRKNME